MADLEALGIDKMTRAEIFDLVMETTFLELTKEQVRELNEFTSELLRLHPEPRDFAPPDGKSKLIRRHRHRRHRRGNITTRLVGQQQKEKIDSLFIEMVEQEEYDHDADEPVLVHHGQGGSIRVKGQTIVKWFRLSQGIAKLRKRLAAYSKQPETKYHKAHGSYS